MRSSGPTRRSRPSCTARPTEPEVAEELGISLDELHAIFGQVSFVNVLALDELLNVNGEKGDKVSLVDTLEDTRAPDPVRAFESQETKHLLARAINLLPEREKIVVTLYYYEGLTLAEIGQVLGRHREPHLPDAHQGRPAAAGQARRPARLSRSTAGTCRLPSAGERLADVGAGAALRRGSDRLGRASCTPSSTSPCAPP